MHALQVSIRYAAGKSPRNAKSYLAKLKATWQMASPTPSGLADSSYRYLQEYIPADRKVIAIKP